MATIRDIARKAGVSQGTVSNVLNKKGNVSAAKVLAVEEAMRALKYTVDQRAKALRGGGSDTLAVLVPTLYGKQYIDFFSGFRSFAQGRGFACLLYDTDDLPQNEKARLTLLAANGVSGVAAFSCLAGSFESYAQAGFSARNTVFAEREGAPGCACIGFDYEKIGREVSLYVQKTGKRRVALLTENECFSSVRAFRAAFLSAWQGGRVVTLATDAAHCCRDVMRLTAGSETFDALVVTNDQFAGRVRGLLKSVLGEDAPALITLAPYSTVPEAQDGRYELDYRMMGRAAAEMLLSARDSGGESAPQTILPAGGLREAKRAPTPLTRKQITLITKDSPTAQIISHLSKMYTQETGVTVKVAIYSFEGFTQTMDSLSDAPMFDVVRTDSHTLSECAERAFCPLNEIDPDIDGYMSRFFTGLSDDYARYEGQVYALPATPSAEILFYRRDLFESGLFRRQYAEEFGTELEVPTTFENYNRVARFFTRAHNPLSPVAYGTTRLLGNTQMAAKEYLSRYFSLAPSLYDENGIRLTSPEAVRALRGYMELGDMTAPTAMSSRLDVARAFAAGDAAITMLFTNFASELVSSSSRVSDRIGFAMAPGGNPLVGGGIMGVSRYSRNREEALKFIKWLCSDEVSGVIALMGSVSPLSRAYDNFEILDTYPWLSIIRECFRRSHTGHIPPGYRGAFDETRFLSIIGMALHTAVNGVMPPEDALKMAKDSFERVIMGKRA